MGDRGILGSYFIIRKEMNFHQGPDLVDTQPNHRISGLAFNWFVLETLGQNPPNQMLT